jgi:hypothetical protein
MGGCAASTLWHMANMVYTSKIHEQDSFSLDTATRWFSTPLLRHTNNPRKAPMEATISSGFG